MEGSQEEGTKNVFWRPAILEACNGNDPQVAGIGEDEGEVEGGPLLEGLEGLEGGTPQEGQVEGGPLLEGLEGGTPLEVKVEGGPLLEGLEGGTPLKVKVEGGPLLEHSLQQKTSAGSNDGRIILSQLAVGRQAGRTQTQTVRVKG